MAPCPSETLFCTYQTMVFSFKYKLHTVAGTEFNSTVLFIRILTYLLTISIKRPGLDFFEKVSIKLPVHTIFFQILEA